MDIAINSLDFARHISKGYLYVNKTSMLSELARSRDVFVITRPRCFGKTMNLNMIHSLFSNENSFGDIEAVFSKLDVWKDKKAVEHAGKYPVIHISLASVRGKTWEHMLEKFKSLMANWIKLNKNILLSGHLTDFDTDVLNSFLTGKPKIEDLEDSLFYFTEWLNAIYGQNVIVLIDDYDTPYIEAVNGGYYKEAHRLLGSFFGRALKDNHNLAFSVVTGILEAAGESISGFISNIHKCNLYSWKFAQYYGFTDSEVRLLAEDSGLVEKLSEIKAWCGRYVFGGVEMHNLWSVMSFLRSREFKACCDDNCDNLLIGDKLRNAAVKTIHAGGNNGLESRLKAHFVLPVRASARQG